MGGVRGREAEKKAGEELACREGERGQRGKAGVMKGGGSLYVGGKAETMADGGKLGAELIDSGKALETLKKLIEVSNRPEPSSEAKAADETAEPETGVQG